MTLKFNRTLLHSQPHEPESPMYDTHAQQYITFLPSGSITCDHDQNSMLYHHVYGHYHYDPDPD